MFSDVEVNLKIREKRQRASVAMTNSINSELPFALTDQGWMKVWSKTNNRPYLWNKLTNESLWELPTMQNPLGLCFNTPPPDSPIQDSICESKREPTPEQCGLQSKKLKLLDFFEINLPINITILNQPPCNNTQSYSEIEAYKLSILSKFKQCYDSRKSSSDPEDSFTTWLTQQKVGDIGML